MYQNKLRKYMWTKTDNVEWNILVPTFAFARENKQYDMQKMSRMLYKIRCEKIILHCISILKVKPVNSIFEYIIF